jgi:hypothetical protein
LIRQPTGSEPGLQKRDPVHFELGELLDHEPEAILVMGRGDRHFDGDRRGRE